MTGGSPRFRARRVPLDCLPEEFVDEWQSLADCSLEGNCFLAPWFLLPAARWLDPDRRLTLLVVDVLSGDDRPRMAALACLHDAAPRRSLPWPHSATYLPLHAYLGGVLLDPRWPSDAVRCLAEALTASRRRIGALRLANFRCDGPVAAAARRAVDSIPGASWYLTRRAPRAALRRRQPAAAGTQGGSDMVSVPIASERADPQAIRRGLRRLVSTVGAVEFRLLRGGAIDDGVIERHLALENAGWKGREGVALMASPGGAAFFRDIARGAAIRGRAFFCELLAGGQVVASTSNFVVARTGFAFKVGWDPRFARCSPGLLIDHALARLGFSLLGDVDLIDGCADPGSHLDGIWEDRIDVADGYLAWGGPERSLLAAIAAARRLRARAQGLLGVRSVQQHMG